MFVIDNQESYSDHSIYFVETDYPREVVETIAKLAGGYAVVGEVRPLWWDGNTMALSRLLSLGRLFGGDGGIRDEARWIPLPLLIEIRDATNVPDDASGFYNLERARHHELTAWIAHREATEQQAEARHNRTTLASPNGAIELIGCPKLEGTDFVIPFTDVEPTRFAVGRAWYVERPDGKCPLCGEAIEPPTDGSGKTPVSP